MRRNPSDPAWTDGEQPISAGLLRLVFLAMGVALLLGMICGAGWTAYHLLGGSFGR